MAAGWQKWLWQGAGSILAVYAVWRLRNALYPFVLAFLLAYLLNPLVEFCQRKGCTRLTAIILVYLWLVIVAGLGFFLVAPRLVHDIYAFLERLPQFVHTLEDAAFTAEQHYQSIELPAAVKAAADEALLSLEAAIRGFFRSLLTNMLALVSHSLGILISPVLAFYMLCDWYAIKHSLLAKLPFYWQTTAAEALTELDQVLSGVIRGQLLTATLVGVFATSGLYLMGIPFAFLSGMFAAVTDIIPYFGSLAGAVPAFVFALAESPAAALKTGILFMVIHQLEGVIIQPYIVGDEAGLPPLAVIFAVFVGGELAGAVGMLLAVPLAAIGKVIYKYVRKILN